MVPIQMPLSPCQSGRFYAHHLRDAFAFSTQLRDAFAFSTPLHFECSCNSCDDPLRAAQPPLCPVFAIRQLQLRQLK